MFSKQRLEQLYEDQEALKNLAGQYLAMINVHDSVNAVEMDRDGVSIETTYWDCGRTETEYYTMPIEYLTNENWKEAEKERQAKEKEEKERKRKEEEERRKKEAEQKEFQLFLELQKKYHDKDEIREWFGNILDLADIQIRDRANHGNMERTSRLITKYGSQEKLIEKGWEVYNEHK